jgi:hypothetical protein
MFRLTVLGDFDFFELEGVDPTLGGYVNLANGSFVGAQIDEADSDYASIHRDLRVLSTVLVFIFCIVMMNMYIGVLGHKYDDFKESVNVVYANEKSECIGRWLLRLDFWSWLFPCIGRCLFRLDLLDPCSNTYKDPDSEDESDDDSDGEQKDQPKNEITIPEIDACRGNWVVVGDSSIALVTEQEGELETVKDNMKDMKKDLQDLQSVKKDLQDLQKKMDLLLKHHKIEER